MLFKLENRQYGEVPLEVQSKDRIEIQITITIKSLFPRGGEGELGRSFFFPLTVTRREISLSLCVRRLP